jgi:hypothetical protein
MEVLLKNLVLCLVYYVLTASVGHAVAQLVEALR